MPTAPNTYQPLFESFENSVGPLTEVWGIDTSTFGEIRLYGNRYSTAGMKEPGQDASVGHGYGTYTVTAMLTGTNAGPAIILWPGDNQYPGQEINLAELTPDGTGRQYATVHWNDNGLNNQNIRFLDGVQSGVFHTYQAVWEPGKITFNVDGHLAAIVTDHVPLDYDHGGQNEVFAFLNNNENTSLIVRDISYTPLGYTGTAPAASTGTTTTTVAGTEVTAQVARLYDTALGRLPESAGLQSLTSSIESGQLTLNQAAASSIVSPEFQSRYGTLDDASFITLLYHNALHRDPDQGGMATWTYALSHGMPRSDLVVAVSESAEHMTATAQTIVNEGAGHYDILIA